VRRLLIVQKNNLWFNFGQKNITMTKTVTSRINELLDQARTHVLGQRPNVSAMFDALGEVNQLIQDNYGGVPGLEKKGVSDIVHTDEELEVAYKNIWLHGTFASGYLLNNMSFLAPLSSLSFEPSEELVSTIFNLLLASFNRDSFLKAGLLYKTHAKRVKIYPQAINRICDKNCETVTLDKKEFYPPMPGADFDDYVYNRSLRLIDLMINQSGDFYLVAADISTNGAFRRISLELEHS